MKTHELAKELLKLPNVPVLTTDGEYGYPENVTGVKIRKSDSNEESILGIKEGTKVCTFKSMGGYSG